MYTHTVGWYLLSNLLYTNTILQSIVRAILAQQVRHHIPYPNTIFKSACGSQGHLRGAKARRVWMGDERQNPLKMAASHANKGFRFAGGSFIWCGPRVAPRERKRRVAMVDTIQQNKKKKTSNKQTKNATINFREPNSQHTLWKTREESEDVMVDATQKELKKNTEKI